MHSRALSARALMSPHRPGRSRCAALTRCVQRAAGGQESFTLSVSPAWLVRAKAVAPFELRELRVEERYARV